MNDLRELDARQQAALDAQLAAGKARADAILAERRAAQSVEAFEHARVVAERSAQVEAASLDSEIEAIRRAQGMPWYDGLYPHQWSGMLFGAGAERFILGDGMGLGKTRTTIGWLDLISAQRVVVVCLAEVADQFAGEIQELAPHRDVYLVSGKSPKARDALLGSAKSSDGSPVVVVNYELFARKNGVLDALIEFGADTVIVDEAHTLKAAGARRNLNRLILAQNVQEQARRDYALDQYLATRSVKNLALVTGTPILNEPSDIYWLLHLVDPLVFRTLAAFNRQYTVLNHGSGRVEFKPGGLKRLQRLLSGFYIARSLEDTGLALPPKAHHVVRVDLDPDDYPKQYRVATQIAKQAKITLESGLEHTIMHLIALTTRKRQANVWAAGIEIRDPDGNVVFSVGDDVDESCKLDAVVREVVRQRDRGRRQVVFSQFKTALAELERRLVAEGVAVARFDGDTASGARVAIKDDFYRGTERRYDVLLANYKTGGVGLNLIGASAVHLLDSEWNPGKRDQAIKRVHRVGQTDQVEVFEYVIPGSVDSWMRNIVRGKERMIADFAGQSVDADAPVAEQLRVALLGSEI